MEQYDMPGNHTSLILDKDKVKVLADKFKECLVNIQRS